jgi:hypothetical protein
MYWPSRAFGFKFSAVEVSLERDSRGSGYRANKYFQRFDHYVSRAFVRLLHRIEACVPEGKSFRHMTV